MPLRLCFCVTFWAGSASNMLLLLLTTSLIIIDHFLYYFFFLWWEIKKAEEGRARALWKVKNG